MANGNGTERDAGAVDGRDYLTRVGKTTESLATMGDVVAMLEYFGSVPSPEDHAPTPYTDADAFDEVNPDPPSAPAPAVVDAPPVASETRRPRPAAKRARKARH